MRTAAQWLAAAAGAVGAALIAGLQIGDVGALVKEPWRLILAIATFLLALIAVGLTIRRAGAVLVVSRSAIGDLLTAETRRRFEGVAFEEKLDPDLAKIVDLIDRNQEWLMPDHDSTGSLFTAWKTAREADRAELHRQLTSVCTFARCELTRIAYQRLSKTITGGWGILFTAAIIALAIAVKWPAEEAPAVVAPYRLDVLLTGSPEALRSAGLDGRCLKGMRLTGVALDGSLTEPVVVTEASPGTANTCPASRFTVSKDVGIPIPYVVTK